MFFMRFALTNERRLDMFMFLIFTEMIVRLVIVGIVSPFRRHAGCCIFGVNLFCFNLMYFFFLIMLFKFHATVVWN